MIVPLANPQRASIGILNGRAFMSSLFTFPFSSLLVVGEERLVPVLGAYTHVGDTKEAPGSLLQLGSAMAAAATWGSESVNGTSLYLSFSL